MRNLNAEIVAARGTRNAEIIATATPEERLAAIADTVDSVRECLGMLEGGDLWAGPAFARIIDLARRFGLEERR